METVAGHSFHKTAGLLLLAATLGACGKPAGKTPRPLADDAENHHFALDPAHGRLLYIRGTYPRKSYLCAEPLAGGRARKLRLAGYSLTGPVFPLRGGHALVIAAPIEGNANSPGARPRGGLLLRVDLERGEVVKAYSLPKGALLFAAGDPAWTDEPVALIGAADGLHLSRLGDSSLLAEEPALEAGRFGAAAMAPDAAAIAAASWDEQGGRLVLLDPLAVRPRREIRLRSPGLVLPLGGGRWLLTLADEENRDTVALLDAASGAVTVLLTSPDPVESLAAGPRAAYALSLSSQGPFDARRPWLRPRTLRRADMTGVQAPWSTPWSRHQGELLAVDEDAGRLWFAVTDRDAAAVWPLSLDSAALAAAAPLIDGASPMVRAARLAVPWMLIMVFAAAISMAGWMMMRGGGGGGRGGGGLGGGGRR